MAVMIQKSPSDVSQYYSNLPRTTVEIIKSTESSGEFLIKSDKLIDSLSKSPVESTVFNILRWSRKISTDDLRIGRYNASIIAVDIDYGKVSITIEIDDQLDSRLDDILLRLKQAKKTAIA